MAKDEYKLLKKWLTWEYLRDNTLRPFMEWWGQAELEIIACYGFLPVYMYCAQIKEHRYGEVIQILSLELQQYPKSRAALSLLGFCYFHVQDFASAADWWVKHTRTLYLLIEYPNHVYRYIHAYTLVETSSPLHLTILVEPPKDHLNYMYT